MPVSYFALGEDAGKQIVKCCSPVCQYVRAKTAKTLTTPAWFILGGGIVLFAVSLFNTIILEGLSARNVRESNPCFITTDLGTLRAGLLFRMTTKSKSNRHPREFFVGDIAVTQENKNGKTQIPIPCGPHPIAGGLFFGNDGKKCRFCRWFFAVYRRGLTPFFFFGKF